MKSIFIIITIGAFNLFAQWQPDVRLTNNQANSFTSENNAWCIASRNDIVHVVWYDNREGAGNYEIFYKRSTNKGIDWGADIRLTNNTASSESPSISVSGSYVHVVWYDNREGGVYDIYYIRSADEGVSWGQETRFTNNPFFQGYPSMSVNGSNVHVVWNDVRDGNREIYYKRSTDDGSSWGQDTRLTNNPGWSSQSCISVSGSYIHVVWSDTRDFILPEIYYKRSTDGGLSWGNDIRMTNDFIDSRYPSVSSFGTSVHIVWWDKRNTNFDIYYKRSVDGGVNWSQDTGITNDPTDAFDPSISVYGSSVHLVWRDWRDSNNEIYYKHSTNGGINWGPDTRLTNDNFVSTQPFITFSGPVLHVAWCDTRDGNSEIYYKRDPTGNLLGIHQISPEVPAVYKLYQNYPNPFNPKTKIKFSIPLLRGVSEGRGVLTKVIIFDILGREVVTLVNQQLQPGTYEVEWDATNYPSGVYFYRLQTGASNLFSTGYTVSKNMILIK